uniref:Uncharacterized protein n=1 Tax=Alexandrium monilatum TaxID=311494 RepID=A0A7S4Q310_9DINO
MRCYRGRVAQVYSCPSLEILSASMAFDGAFAFTSRLAESRYMAHPPAIATQKKALAQAQPHGALAAPGSPDKPKGGLAQGDPTPGGKADSPLLRSTPNSDGRGSLGSLRSLFRRAFLARHRCC